MADIKVGDKIKIIRDGDDTVHYFKIGDICTIKMVTEYAIGSTDYEAEKPMEIKDSDGAIIASSMRQTIHRKDFELI